MANIFLSEVAFICGIRIEIYIFVGWNVAMVFLLSKACLTLKKRINPWEIGQFTTQKMVTLGWKLGGVW